MSLGWGSLPLLSLRCVLDHLSLEDALAALSTCKHWRSSILLYEGHKDTLKLRVKHLEKNLFLTRVFRKYTRKLHIYIDSCGEDLENFMNFILPQFFDTLRLQELVFIGPNYIHIQNGPVAKINRIIAETLIFKNAHCLENLSLLGCEMTSIKNENDRYKHKSVEYFSRPLSFSTVPSPENSLLTNGNVALMMFSTLQHIIFDYDLMSTQTLETINQLSNISHLTLNIGSRRPVVLNTVDWRNVNRNLEVTMNIISVSQNVLEDIIDRVFVEGMPLVSLKVMFCKILHTGVLAHVVREYKAVLRELVWADAPHDSPAPSANLASLLREADDVSDADDHSMFNVNPLILLCWQCTQLQRLAVHGYWIWQYDVVGFVRLRRSLRALHVSAVNERDDGVPRVLVRDVHALLPGAVLCDLVQQVNTYTEFKWSPIQWEQLHPALRTRASSMHRADYVLQEVWTPLPALPIAAAVAAMKLSVLRTNFCALFTREENKQKQPKSKIISTQPSTANFKAATTRRPCCKYPCNGVCT